MEKDTKTQVFDLQYTTERYVACYTLAYGNPCHCHAEFELYKHGELVRKWHENNTEQSIRELLEQEKTPGEALSKSISALNMQQQISKKLDKKSS